MMKRTASAATWLAAATLLAACASGPRPQAGSAGPFLNHGFEHATPDGYPAGWYIEAESHQLSIGLDSKRSVQGDRSLRVHAADGAPVVLYAPLLIDDCLSTISAEVSAFVAASGPKVSLFWLMPGAAPQMGPAVQPDQGRWQTAFATRAASQQCVPRELMLGLFVTGPGEVWIDQLELVADGVTYGTTVPPSAEPESDELAAIRQQLVAFHPDDAGGTFADVNALEAMVGDAAVVGIGENSHGARELFRFKAQWVRLLVERLGFRVFALEMPAQPAEVVDDYVLGLSSDRQSVVRALSYPAWQTEEMLAIIDWLRGHNRSADTPVVFRGIDTPPGQDDHRTDDLRMADRVIDLLGPSDEGARIVVWADNTHVTKMPGAMGGFLAARLGKAYLAVGMTFDRGHYSANGPELRYPAAAGYPGTHEYVMARVGVPEFVLDLRELPADNVLRETLEFRYLGSRPQHFHQFYPHRLADHFDLVGFVERTEATHFLLDHDFSR